KPCKLLNSRLTRWVLALQEYQYTIEGCTGKENVLADSLSRHCYSERTNSLTEPTIALIERKPNPELLSQLGDILEHQRSDPEINKILELKKKELNGEIVNENLVHYSIIENLL